MHEGKKCRVTNFGDPHLFFVLYDDNQKALQDLEKVLEERFINTIVPFPKTDQVYVIQHEGKYKRAIALSKPKSYYFCWLIDYGELVWEKKFYTLPADCQSKPLSIKAGLNKTVGLETYIDDTGSNVFSASNKFSPGASISVKNLIWSAKEVYFKEDLVVRNVHFGEIHLVMKDGSTVDLINKMEKNNILAIDEPLFNQMVGKSLEVINYIRKLPIDEGAGIGRGCSRNSRKLLAKPITSNQEYVNSWLASTPYEIAVLTDTCMSQAPESSDTDSNLSEIEPKLKENVLTRKSPPYTMKKIQEKMRESLNSSKRLESSDSDATVNLSNKDKLQESKINDYTFRPISRNDEGSSNEASGFTSFESNLSELTPRIYKTREGNIVTPKEARSSLKGLTPRDGSSKTSQTFGGGNSSEEGNFDSPTLKGNKSNFAKNDNNKNASPTLKGDKSSPICGKGNIMTPKEANNFTNQIKNSSTPKGNVTPNGTVKSAVTSPTPAFNCNTNGATFQPSPVDILKECKSSNSSIISAFRKLKSSSTSVQSVTFTESESEKSEKFLKSSKESEDDDNGGYYNNDKSIVKSLRCNCADCTHWDEDDFETKPEEFKVKKIKTIVRPGLLLREEDGGNVPLSKSLSEVDEFSTMKKMIMPNVLVHGTVTLFPQQYVTDVPFIDAIHRSLRALDYTKCKPVQQYGWPAIMRGMNLCIVDITMNDKTMTYVAPFCSLLMEGDRYQQLPEVNGPKVLVLCSESREVERVYNRFHDVLAKTRMKLNLKLLQAVAPLNPALMSQFKSPCDILITTPPILVTFLARNTFNLKRLCHLVVEDIDEIFNVQKDILEKILNVVQEMLKHRTCSKQVQFICTSQHWTFPIENLMKRLNTVPVVIIGNPLEAALYGRSDISITEVQSNTKHYKLYDTIKDKYRVYKTIVVCKQDEIEALKNLFELYGISFQIAHDRMSLEDTMEIYKSWCSRSGGEYVVLICTDFVLRKQMNVRDCSILINYTLDTPWSDFVKRWLCLLDNYKSPLNANQDGFTCKIYIFIDENSGMEITKIVKYFRTLGTIIPPNVIEYCENYTQSVENKKIRTKQPLCENWKQKLTCSTSICPDRHILDQKLDSPKRIISGTLKFQVRYVRDVNYYKIIPLQFKTSDGDTHEFNNTKPEIDKLLEKTKMKEFVMEAKVGKMYLLEEEGKFIRCIVKRIVEHDRITKMPSKVIVEGVDEGCLKRVLTGNLFLVPEKLEKTPSSLMDLIIINIVPLNKEKCWAERARKQLIGNFEDDKKSNIYCTGKVALHLGNTVWMENFQVHSQLSCMTQVLTYFTLLPFLVQQNLAKVEKGQLPKFYEECDKCGLEKPKYDSTAEVKAVVKQSKPQWAFLPSDERFNPVNFSSGFSPRRFFVKLRKFSDLYKKFEESIQNLLQQRSLQLKPEEIITGSCYLAPDPENELVYSRAIVTSVTEDTADCFYVDYGDVAYIPLKDIKYLPNDYITRLPFQCIECSLHGVEALDGEWSDEALDILYQYCMESNGNNFRTLYSLIMKEEAGSFAGTTKYTIQLYDNSENIPKMINKVMIDCGFAIPNENEPLDLETKLEVYEKKAESDDELEEVNINNAGVDDLSEDEDLDGFDYVCNNVEAFVKEMDILTYFLPKESKSIEPKPTTSTEQAGDNLPQMNALPMSNTYTPLVEWHQTNEVIQLWIKLSVTDYQIKLIARRAISFSAEYSNRTYTLQLQFFDLVNKHFSHTLGGFSINVTLTKIKQVEWPRLTLSTEPNKKIRYNLEKVEGLHDEDEGILQKVRRWKKRAKELNEQEDDEEDEDCYYDEFGSDESDSDFSDAMGSDEL